MLDTGPWCCCWHWTFSQPPPQPSASHVPSQAWPVEASRPSPPKAHLNIWAQVGREGSGGDESASKLWFLGSLCFLAVLKTGHLEWPTLTQGLPGAPTGALSVPWDSEQDTQLPRTSWVTGDTRSAFSLALPWACCPEMNQDLNLRSPGSPLSLDTICLITPWASVSRSVKWVHGFGFGLSWASALFDLSYV